MRLFVLALVVVVVMLAGASGQSDCQGQVGDFAYDLTPLAQKLGGVDQQATDSLGQTYYYQVCGVVTNNFCQSVGDMTPAVCQKDVSSPADYHDCGNQRTASFQQLPDAADSDGFTLSFTGGEAGRASRIYFKCDKSKDPGVFSFGQEDPIKTYDFQYVSRYACPVSPSSSPTPPPSRSEACCLYQANSDPDKTRTLCAVKCPAFLGGYSLVYNWTASPCTRDTCFFNKHKQ